MPHLICAGCVVIFRSGPLWDWVGWDGTATLQASRNRMDHQGEMMCVDQDLIALHTELVSQKYKAIQFPDTPGVVSQAEIEIDEGTLFDRLMIEGCPGVTSETTGRFRIVVSPSMKSGTPPVPDPQTTHEGTWTIQAHETPRTQCE